MAMGWQQAVVGAMLAGMLALLLRGRIRPGGVFAGAAFVFILLDFVTLTEALRQLTNPGLVSVVLLVLLSVVLDKCSLLEGLVDRLLRGPYRWALFKLVLSTAGYSAFLNNTAVVASMIGPLSSARRHPASRLLLPMCYAATLGGVLTLVGTSTNLLVNSFLLSRGLPGLQMFDLLPLGAVLLTGCGAAMVVLYPWLLPLHRPSAVQSTDYFIEARLQPDSPLVGGTVESQGLRNLGHLFLTEIVRGHTLIAPVEPHEQLQADDLLVFAGDVTRLDLLAKFPGLRPSETRADLPLDNLVEVVVTSDGSLNRRTIKEADFRAHFDAAVIAVRRRSERLGGSLGSICLEAGDTLVLATGSDFDKRLAQDRALLVVSRPQQQKLPDHRQGWLALAAFAGVIGLAAVGVIDFPTGLLALLVLFVATGLARWDELRRHMPYEIIVVIASALVIGEVMIETGTARLLTDTLLGQAEHQNPYAALAAVLLLAWLLTELMSNNAAAALALPVALGTAEALGLSPLPFVMAVLYGASCSFLTPYGYQTNLMVMSPGRYRLGDYIRAGLPLTTTYLAICLVLLPRFYPFH